MPLFGEIVEPSTRAINAELCEDEEEHYPKLTINLSWIQKPTSSVDLFLLVYGNLAEDFANSFIISETSKPIGEIKVTEESTITNETFKKNCHSTSLIYNISGAIVCLVDSQLRPDSSFELIESIKSILEGSKTIVVLTSESMYNFKNTDELLLPCAFLRELHSSTYKQQLHCETLAVPNLISGIPAQVLTWSEIFGKPCVLYVCYSDQDVLDSITSAPFTDLISKWTYQQITLQTPTSSRDKINKGKIIGSSSNMYL